MISSATHCADGWPMQARTQCRAPASISSASRPPGLAGRDRRAMNVDRRTMVALIDDLQLKGLVQRRQDPDDRRKNVVELTDAGRGAVREAAESVGRAEREFLAPLSAAEAAQFKKTLRKLLGRVEALPGEH